ncbi:unnamed protein product [Cylindrotheca closterium]|uniref:Hexose transporter 1 n=1 Tax=Cylindrotheca closterium TaxID=2856 RepID=A0AAD2FWA9_9STRA|nr:unnamed protein product [Cylindrotheca closterium]
MKVLDTPKTADLRNDSFINKLAIVASMSGLLFGYDTGVVSGAIVYMRVQMDLSPFQVEVVVSSTILAAAFSSFWGHHIMDKYGRKFTLMVASSIFIVGSIIMGASFGPYHKGLTMMVIGRITVGIAIGLASEAGPLYISECAPPPLRGKLTTLFNIAVVGGQVFAAILCGALSYLPWSYNWRLMLAFGAFPALGQLLGFLSLPISPAWLVLQGKEEEAEIVLRQIRMIPVQQNEDGEIIPDPVQKELKEIVDEFEESKKKQHVSLFRLWTAYPSIRRAMILGCSLWAVSQLAGINTIMYYGASIVRKAGLGGDRSFDIWITVPLYFMQLVGIIICYNIIDRWGRRPTLLFSMTLVLIGLLTIGTGFATDNGILTIIGMVCYLFAFGVGLSTMPYTMNAEIYPTEYRGVCVAQSTGVFWATNFVVSLTFLTLARVLGNAGVFFLYAGIVFVSEIYFYFVVPETSGLSLHEIQAIFEQKPEESVGLSDTSTDGIETTEYGSTDVSPDVSSSPAERKLPMFV